MGIRIETRYEASTAVKADRTFWCMRCDFKCPALVRGTGSASLSVAGWGGPDDGSASIVAWQAKKAAEANAHDAFDMIPCPKCGTTDPTAMGRFRVRAGLVAAFVGAIAAVVGYGVAIMVIWPPSGATGPVGAAIGLAVGAGGVILERVLEISTLRSKVRLFPDEAPSNDLTRL
jgi:hypothetical protein